MNGTAAVQPMLEPDRAEAEKFVTALGGDVNAVLTFQTFDDRKERKLPALVRVLHGTLEEHWQELARVNAAGAGVFVMVNEGDGQVHDGEKTCRTKKNVRGLRALFADDDSGELSPMALELAPSILVQSKRGLHPYWRLRAGEPLDRFTPAQVALSNALGTPADDVKDLPRVMRLPGFLHRKAEPFLVRVVQVKDVAYTIAEVLEGFGIDATPAASRAAPKIQKGKARNGHAATARDEQRYVERQIVKARTAIESARIGERNTTLASWAYTLGGYVGGGYLARTVAAMELAASASRVGLEEVEFQDVIDRQLDAGAKAPLNVPESDEPPMPDSENPPGPGARPSNEKRAAIEYVLTSMASVQPKPVQWFWRDRIAFGKITILDGDPGNGKSTITLDLAARLTTGRPMPGEKLPVGPPVRVLLISLEDDPADTLRPRLDAAGANCDLVDMLSIKAKGRELIPALSDHLVQIEEALLETAAKFLVLDPLAALMGKADAFKDQEVRSVLAPLKGVLERNAVASLCIRHFNKSQGGASALYRGGGSIAIAASARSVLAVARNPQNPIQRVLALVKGNGAEPQAVPSLAYSIEKVFIGGIETIRIHWEGVSAYTADDLLAAQVPDSREERSALDEAKDVILQVLANGPVPSKELEKQAREAGVSEKTLHRARAALHVKAVKSSGGQWVLSLPDRSSTADGRLDPLAEGDDEP